MTSSTLSRRDFLRASATLLAGSLVAACSQAPAPTATPTAAMAPTFTVPPARPTDPPVQISQTTVNVLARELNFPEGPAFDPQGNLWCTEMNAGNLIKIENGRVKRIPFNGRPNSLAFDRQGRLWAPDSENMQIRRYDPATEEWTVMADKLDGKPLLQPNDLSFDARGNLLFTCPNFQDETRRGYVCCLKPDGTLLKIADQLYRPNGLDIVDGGKALVVADTLQKVLFKGSWDADTCTWGDHPVWAKVGGYEGPDGMAFGADGRLYCAIYGDGVLRVVGPDGKVTQELRLPGSNPTNVAVDPSGKLGLVVTETEHGELLSLPDIQPGVAIFDGGDVWP
jgi:gluconolactonase